MAPTRPRSIPPIRHTALSVIFWLGCLLWAGCASPSDRPSAEPTTAFVMEGVDSFWRVVDVLEQDEQPTNAEWDTLFAAPGYAYYFTEENHSRAEFKELMHLVFMPSEAGALSDSLASGGRQLRPDLRPLHAFLAAKNHRDDLEAFQETLAEQRIVPTAAERAAELLPEGALRDASGAWNLLSIRASIYSLDGRGPGGFVVVDLLLMYLMGEQGTTLFVSHEFHHAGRVSTIDPQAHRDDPRYGVLWALDRVQSEGIADLIDKPYFINELQEPLPDSAVDGLAWSQAVLSVFVQRQMADAEATPSTLQRVDSLLVQAAQADADGREDDLKQHADAIRRSIPNNGHPNGFFMASLIKDTLGTERMAATANDPFTFVRLYNEAARQSDGEAAPLSDEAMEYLARLETEYTAGS